jgi:hypothetical protein
MTAGVDGKREWMGSGSGWEGRVDEDGSQLRQAEGDIALIRGATQNMPTVRWNLANQSVAVSAKGDRKRTCSAGSFQRDRSRCRNRRADTDLGLNSQAF